MIVKSRSDGRGWRGVHQSAADCDVAAQWNSDMQCVPRLPRERLRTSKGILPSAIAKAIGDEATDRGRQRIPEVEGMRPLEARAFHAIVCIGIHEFSDAGEQIAQDRRRCRLRMWELRDAIEMAVGTRFVARQRNRAF